MRSKSGSIFDSKISSDYLYKFQLSFICLIQVWILYKLWFGEQSLIVPLQIGILVILFVYQLFLVKDIEIDNNFVSFKHLFFTHKIPIDKAGDVILNDVPIFYFIEVKVKGMYLFGFKLVPFFTPFYKKNERVDFIDNAVTKLTEAARK